MMSCGDSGADVLPDQADVPNATSRSKVPGGALATGMLGYWEGHEWECWQPGRDLP